MPTFLQERATFVVSAKGRQSSFYWFFAFFVVSGFCGLIYEVVWVRLAMASFGVNTAVVSIVISMFMAGLGLGSWLAGRMMHRVCENASLTLRIYAVAELLIGISSLAVPLELKLGRQLRKRPKKFRDERRLFAHRQFEERRSRFFQNRLSDRGKPTEEVRGRHDAGVAQDPAMLMANGFLRPLRGNLKPAKAFADDSESGMKAFPLRDIAALLVGGLHHLSGRAEHSANFQEASLCDMQRSYLVGFGRKRSDGKKSGWRVAKFFNDKITQRSRNA